MQSLKFYSPYRITRTTIHEGKVLNVPEPIYYERFSTVFTKKGIVCVLSFDWATNKNKLFYTHFETVINGIHYSAALDEGKLSDRQTKHMATKFMTLLFKTYNP